jgi:hypothetical protein
MKSLFLALALYSYVNVIKGAALSYIQVGAFIIFSGLAFITKQDAIILTGALVVAGSLTQNFERWFIIGLLAFAFMSVLSVLYAYSLGPYFTDNFLLGFKFQYSLDYFKGAIWKSSYYRLLFIVFIVTSTIFSLRFTKHAREKWLVYTLVISSVLTFLASLKWGAGINYYQDLMLICLLSLSYLAAILFPDRSSNLGRWGVIAVMLSILILDVVHGNIKIYSRSEESKYESIARNISLVKSKIDSIAKGEEYHLFTFEKGLCNELCAACLFPAYETTDPQFLSGTLRYNKGATDFTLSVYPDINLYSEQRFLTLLKGKVVYSVMAKEIGFIDYFDLVQSEFSIIDSTDLFYIYQVSRSQDD